MELWIALAVLVVIVIIYISLPGKKPTIDIKKFPRKYPDEKVRALQLAN